LFYQFGVFLLWLSPSQVVSVRVGDFGSQVLVIWWISWPSRCSAWSVEVMWILWIPIGRSSPVSCQLSRLIPIWQLGLLVLPSNLANAVGRLLGPNGSHLLFTYCWMKSSKCPSQIDCVFVFLYSYIFVCVIPSWEVCLCQSESRLCVWRICDQVLVGMLMC